MTDKIIPDEINEAIMKPMMGMRQCLQPLKQAVMLWAKSENDELSLLHNKICDAMADFALYMRDHSSDKPRTN